MILSRYSNALQDEIKETFFKRSPFDDYGYYSYYRTIKMEGRTTTPVFGGALYTEQELEATQFKVMLDDKHAIHMHRLRRDGTIKEKFVRNYKWQMRVCGTLVHHLWIWVC